LEKAFIPDSAAILAAGHDRARSRTALGSIVPPPQSKR
jgi:hypothetical protein